VFETNCLPGLPGNAKSAACSAALFATRKEERKNEKEEVIYFIYSPVPLSGRGFVLIFMALL
jgi:hypothetical protein